MTNSLYPNDPLKKTLIIGKIDHLNPTDSDKALINLIVPTNETYTITIYKNDVANISASKDIKLVPYSAISDPKTDITVTTTGNRIAKILFKYPIRNAFSSVPVDASGNPITTGTASGHILYNFYALYYNRDTNSSIDPTKGEWSGAINLDNPSLTATLSSDGKALILQDTLLSIPLTEDISHILAVNKGKYYLDPTDKNKVLTDYSEEQRIIPSMEVGFDVSITSTPAVPISAVAPVRNQITITFSNAVLTPYFTSTNPISNAKILFLSDGSIVKLSSIKRVPDTFNSLIFNIDNSNPLPSGIITIGVGSPKTDSGDLIDACGYIVPFTKLAVNVGSIPPTLESAVQDTDSSNKDNTVIDLTFSTSMLSDVSGKGANNPANYTFLDSSGVSQPIQATEFITGSNNSKIKMTFKNLLGAGLYTLKIQANAITDSIGENIAYTTYSVTIEDTTQPSVIEIIGLNSKTGDTAITDSSNALIIKYKTPMNIIGGTANSTCAADKIDNYKFYESTVSATNAPLPIGTVATPLKNNNWIRFILPVGTYPTFDTAAHDGTPNPNYSIYIGYTGLDTINYVCNTSGNIYPLCSLKTITATVPLIDLSKGTAEIISDSELVYTYTDGSIVNGQFYHNEFNKIDASDFVIGVSDKIITTPTPLSIKDVSLSQDGTKITFTFDPKTFTSAYKYAYIGASESNTIIDIFGKGLTGLPYNKEIINSVPSTLVGISLTDISRTPVAGSIANGYPVTIAFKFSNAIKNTSASDFLIAFNNAINIPIDSATISTVNANTIILKGTIPYIATDELINSIAIRTSADSSFLSTKDINGNTIKSFNYLFVDNLSVEIANMTFLASDDLNGASLTAVFNKDLDFTTNPLLSVANSKTGIDFTN
ncbi:hypothetical protein [Clostridium saccharobutylicum]|uniref:Uncharacterized protein n=1 Tax=Clostridium saccharobutylicum DSM 13864 TaxID=1345695 RepID=U5MU74_CLOSA|nr:hypothetical protein [Clostridium saccharobutylicum]AGX43216.1 hypothetical protein CLSA_c22390 [Clostridium saccharobutylicum DSM 13864]AQR90515.1 hypothetical protein CLOSC_22340 [Clostridium saccharobutylicum]AQS00421.1 hypothetical protein CSACC_22410 [Clostridium saccharobutylicum]AQS14404.1 hypothetical protein CLOSACC_22410 [Clostridium saccharobutylicum]MBA2906879.1 hypothetical protein [Clostridium saccharobutylicum]